MNGRQTLSGRMMNRRGVLGLLAGAGALAATGRLALPAAANSGVKYRTTSQLNMRKSPKSTAALVTSVPVGAIVIDYDGEVVNGYRSVDYNGKVGWVLRDYLEPLTPDEPEEPLPPVIGGAKTTASVNFRTGPGAGYSVIKVVPKGTWVEITAAVENGFRFVYVGSKGGWIADAYLGGGDTGAFITTAKVNLRSGAGTGYSIKLVLPKGATVVDYDDEVVNGFRHVDYNGTTGWVSNAYLKKA